MEKIKLGRRRKSITEEEILEIEKHKYEVKKKCNREWNNKNYLRYK
jgi:hypothetical protein